MYSMRGDSGATNVEKVLRQAAIVKGAALRGLMGVFPRKRRCRRHYGVAMRKPFRQGIDPESQARYNVWDKGKVCEGRIHWMIRKVGPADLSSGEAANRT